MTNHHDRYLDLHTETLEHRRLLAGNVDAFVTGNGDLVINGDNDDNRITIRQVLNGQILTVEVLGDNTQINGDTQPVELGGITDDIRINLRNGNNRFLIDVPTDDASNEFPVPDRLTIRTGNGSDRITFANGVNLVVNGSLRINTGGGADSIINVGSNSIVQVGDDLSINTGSGSDFIEIAFPWVSDRFSVNSGGDSDSVTIGVDSDAQLVPFTAGGRFSVVTGSGSDSVDLFNIVALDRADVRTSGGADSVSIRRGTYQDRLSVNLGGDDDSLATQQIVFSEARFNGNGGSDSLVMGLMDVDSVSHSGFENVSTFLVA